MTKEDGGMWSYLRPRHRKNFIKQTCPCFDRVTTSLDRGEMELLELFPMLLELFPMQ